MTVRFLEVAEIELDHAVQWYELQAPGLGDAFLIEVLSAAERISLYVRRGIGRRVLSDGEGGRREGVRMNLRPQLPLLGQSRFAQTIEKVRLMIKLRRQKAAFDAMFGKYRWRGNLDRSRKGRGVA